MFNLETFRDLTFGFILLPVRPIEHLTLHYHDIMAAQHEMYGGFGCFRRYICKRRRNPECFFYGSCLHLRFLNEGKKMDTRGANPS
jgi:hypothetical protein